MKAALVDIYHKSTETPPANPYNLVSAMKMVSHSFKINTSARGHFANDAGRQVHSNQKNKYKTQWKTYKTLCMWMIFFINEFKVVCVLHVTQCVTCLLYLSCSFISMVLVLVSVDGCIKHCEQSLSLHVVTSGTLLFLSIQSHKHLTFMYLNKLHD